MVGAAPAAAVGGARVLVQATATNPAAIPATVVLGVGGIARGTVEAAGQNPEKFIIQWVALDALTGGIGGVRAAVRGGGGACSRTGLRRWCRQGRGRSLPVRVPIDTERFGIGAASRARVSGWQWYVDLRRWLQDHRWPCVVY